MTLPSHKDAMLDYYFGILILKGLATYKDIRDGVYSIKDLENMHRYIDMENYIDYMSHKKAKQKSKNNQVLYYG